MIEILHPETDRARIDELCRPGSGFHVADAWEHALPELQELARFSGEIVPDEGELEKVSRYAVYPWRSTIVRIPEDSLFHRLRTARNRWLITQEEQDTWSSAQIAIAGLSVGASVLHVCALTGARHFRIADPDHLGPTNLNRLTGSVCDLGVPKAVLATRRTLEADPYAAVEVFGDGYAPEIAGAFLGGGAVTPARVLLEEMDDLAMKVAVRVAARAAGIPVIMVTDDGDNVIVDVERYDLDPDYPLFHGRAGDVTDLDADALRDPTQRVRLAGAIVGDDVAPRLTSSLAEVGRSLPSWPQLGTAASLAGVVGAMMARKLVCGDDIASGRHHIRIDAAAGC